MHFQYYGEVTVWCAQSPCQRKQRCWHQCDEVLLHTEFNNLWSKVFKFRTTDRETHWNRLLIKLSSWSLLQWSFRSTGQPCDGVSNMLLNCVSEGILKYENSILYRCHFAFGTLSPMFHRTRFSYLEPGCKWKIRYFPIARYSSKLAPRTQAHVLRPFVPLLCTLNDFTSNKALGLSHSS